jgi:OOP family OmpA-OmpF porin
MKFMHLFQLVSLFVGISACTSKPKIKEFPKTANAKEEITNLDSAIQNSKAQNTDLLAPLSLKEARNSLDKANEMEKEHKDNEKILKEIALGHAYLERGETKSAENREKLKDVLVARDAAITARAQTLLPGALAKIDNKVKEETQKSEKDQEDKIKERRAEFIAAYLDVELAAIKKQHLGASKFLIDEAIKNGARDLTPKTLATTQLKYREVDEYISQNRYQTLEIQTRSYQVFSYAKKLDDIMARARGVSASTTEEIALRLEAEDLRLRKTQHALNEEHEANLNLAATNNEMTKEQMLDAVYEEARAKFNPEEAEVYKQGKNIIIRLKSLEFKKSQAVLDKQNFVTLSKVEEIIQSFDQSKVTIEGHTDSTGGKNFNQKLSERRAETVKEYLEVNSSNKNIEFESLGFGFEKPVSSNKTVKGRAQNRRVDVVIEPKNI